jgi:hypothetical protein
VSFTFRPAVRENVGLLIGLMGSSGSGKTYTGMRLAKGIAGDRPFAVIDTEAGRAKHYADLFRFDHGDLKPPFAPSAYADAIAAADAAGYPVIVVDSFSHEHAGEGGILDMQEAEYQRMGNRDSMKMASWIRPKMEHKKMVQRLLQVRAHLILCFRAEQKVDMVRERGDDGKMHTKVVPKQSPVSIDGWIPICEKNLPFELTASFLLTADRPGIPRPIKLQEQHRALFPLDQPITEESGRRLAEWARGGEIRQNAGAEVRPAATESRTNAGTAGPTTRYIAVIAEVRQHIESVPQAQRATVTTEVFGVRTWNEVAKLPLETLEAAIATAEGANISRLEASCIVAKERAS